MITTMADFKFCTLLICFITTLSSAWLVCGLPLQENVNDGDVPSKQPEAINSGSMFPSGMQPPPPGALNDGAVPVKQPQSANPGSMFPSGMPPPPSGALNDGAIPVKQPQPANPGSMFPSGMPPPPPGAVNDGAIPVKQPQPANPGSMFPSGMPPPPPGAVNDGAQPVQQPQPANPGSMFTSGMPPPPPGALNDGAIPVKQPQPANPGSMFPSGMPPPPPGALNDGAQPVKQTQPANPGSMFPSGMPPPPPGALNDGAQPVKQPQPANPGSMFPSGMPPPPPGALNDGAVSPKQPQSANPGSVFPSDIPPPPPGAVDNVAQTTIQRESQYQTIPSSNHPNSLPGKSQSSNSPAESPDNAVAEPNYLTGFQTPNNAAPPTGQEVPILNPSQQHTEVNNQTASVIPTGNIADDASQNISPNNPNAVAPFSPDSVSLTDGAKLAEETGSVVHSETQSSPDEASPNEQGVDGNLAQPQDETKVIQVGIDTVPDKESFEESIVIVEEEGPESSDYSFMNSFFDLQSEDESDYFGMNAFDSYTSPDYDFGGEEDQTEMTINFGVSSSDTYGEMESSFYSNLDWILSDGSESYENSDSDSRFEVVEEADVKQEHNWGDDWKPEDQEPIIPDVTVGLDDDMQAGSLLILYCIPAIILAVLIILAWRNYRGRIKVVTVAPAAKNYDWREKSGSREQLEPMLARGADEDGY
ncbi:uncharacterized protein [Diadema antillarum]|uniref:uncharacterized protein n=1 Tax=Diadema antillarum TaxID=105358 RepID=UPI003A88490F